MVSLALTSLLSMLEDIKIDIGALSESKKDPELFKELLELLRQENPDPKAVKSIVQRLEIKSSEFTKETPSNSKKKDVSQFQPVQIEIDDIPVQSTASKKTIHLDKNLFISNITETKIQKIPITEEHQESDTTEMVQKPIFVNSERTVSKPSDNIFHARYISHLFLEQKTEEAQAVHTIRSSHTIKELVRNADKFGLNLVDLKITTEKSEKISTPSDTKKSPLPSITILQKTEHLSKSAALTILQPKREKSEIEHSPPSKNRATLQNLLIETAKETKQETSVKKEKSTIQKSDFSSLLSDLGKITGNLESDRKKMVPISKTVTEKNSSPPIPESETLHTKSDLPDTAQTEIKTKAAEHLTQKIVEARNTVRHFAQTLKEQVENYKPPFTRMQLSLDPKELGSVEVTLISRGNNLHIQVNSNPTAIGVMAAHGGELKNQLVSMGFTDIQMQFNMNQQQQGRQQRHNPGGGYTETKETPDFYESLELIIPQYV